MQPDVAAGLTAADVSENVSVAPDGKTCTRKHLCGICQKQEYMQN
jgi:hypothetical protein